MKFAKKHLWFVWAIPFLGSGAVSACATGFDLPDQDAFVIARGMAFVATADNPSAIYYNPAGIVQLPGNNLRAGLYGIYLDPSFNRPHTDPTFHNEDKSHALPQLYYTCSPENLPLSFGLGIFSPFGLSVRWSEGTGFRSIATQGALTSLRINPVMAFKLSPTFSIGGGVEVNYANVDLRQGLTPFPKNDLFRFKGEGWDVSYNLGLLWQAHDKISLGVSFHSPTSIGLEGQTQTRFTGLLPTTYRSASTDFSFPLKAVFGISYRPTPDWNLEFNADYTDWNNVRTILVRQSAPVPPLLPQEIPLTLNWESSWYFEFGGTRHLGKGWSVSAGYIYNENSVPDAHYTPLVADLDRHFFSFGTGYKGKRFDFDIAYQFGYGPTRTVSGSAPSAAGETANGNYGFISHAVAVSTGWHF